MTAHSNVSVAEHRGPGVHHGFDENHEDFDMPMELDSRAAVSNFNRLSRGIIILGDGPGFGIQSSGGDVDMIDHENEDQDLEAQVSKHTPSGSEEDADSADERSRREETPGPQANLSSDTLPSRAHVNTTSKEPGPKPDAAEQASSASVDKPKDESSKA
jgi:hypothetical protein